ncbi:MAG: class I SAM-dependent methyltransferase [Alphaproteobacteria bacterium]|nr:class I SAM-dependent methyltransferase [Alphaproteobacteria bacterium]
MALAPIIKRMIAAQGYITIAQFMELVLQHPEYGYYRKHDPIGKRGDFITAPEISQMFGELIGLWFANAWEKCGRPDPFVLLELGPGRGTMMEDMLRAASRMPGFAAAMQLFLLDSNETLRAMQTEKLGGYNPRWIDDLEEIPALPLCVMANEFFDSLPIRQFELTDEGWSERVIAYEGGELCFALMQPDEATTLLLQGRKITKLGTVIEINPVAQDVLRKLSHHIATHRGAGLFVDYGYSEPPGRNTFQAQANHEVISPFERLGDADLTAHVDFAALRRAVDAGGAQVRGMVSQGMFLHQLGVEVRAKQLWVQASNEQREEIEVALHRLVSPSQMGVLFKVLGIADAAMPHLPGFDPIS